MSWASLSTKQQGNIGVGAAIAYFTSKGCTVCLPLNDSQDYDLVVDHGGALKRVQVKTTRYREPSGNFQVCLKSSGGTAGKEYHCVKDGTSDLLYVLTEAGDSYIIPTVELTVKKLTLDSRYQAYKEQ